MLEALASTVYLQDKPPMNIYTSVVRYLKLERR